MKTLWRFARILFFHLWIEPHLSSLVFPLRHGSGAGCSIGSFDTSVYYATAQALPEVASLSPGLCGAAAFPSVFLCRNVEMDVKDPFRDLAWTSCRLQRL